MAGCKVVTMAMSDGALAEEIGQRVADQMGFRYINDEIIGLAASKANVTPGEVDRVEHTKLLADRIVDALSTMSLGFAGEAAIGTVYELLPLQDQSALYRNMIRDVLRELGTTGNVVIGAHAASIQLAGLDGLLRVFITASPEVRMERVGRAAGILPEDAKKRVEHGDNERAAYFRRFYDLQRELPTHYDLVINTDRLSPDAATQIIVSAAEAMG
jgi:cytidylate kinase